MTDPDAEREARKWRLQHAQRISALARESGYEMSCSLTTSRIFSAVGSSNGLFACQPSTQAHCKALVYAPKRSAVGISEGRSFRLSEVDPTALTERALETARASLDPQEIEAGRMTVILEAQALAELLLPVMRQFDQKAVDDNRSFLRKLDGSSHLGSEMFAKTVTVRSDPYDAATPSAPFTLDGQKLGRKDWIRDGVVAGLTLSRSAALQKQSVPTPFPTNFIMEGGSSTMEELIASTERGLLVRGFGPVLIEDPGNCMLNAATRGGLFLIENGKTSHACRNLVLQETGVHLLRHIEALTKPMPVQPHGVYFPLLLPAVKIAEMNFAGMSGTL